MAKKMTRHHPRAHHRAQQERTRQDTDSLPVGSPLQHPDAAHLQRVERLQTEMQSIITDLQNNRDDLSQLFPAIVERLQQVQATVLRIVQGPHTAPMEAADQPPQPLVAHSTATRGGLAVGSERPTARAGRGQQARQADTEANEPQTPPYEPPPQSPPAKQEPGAHA